VRLQPRCSIPSSSAQSGARRSPVITTTPAPKVAVLLSAVVVFGACGGDEATTTTDEAEAGFAYVRALGQADCAQLLAEGTISDGWAEEPPIASLPENRRTPSDVLEAARRNAAVLSAETREAYVAGCKTAVDG
jgi:hypothetical protein